MNTPGIPAFIKVRASNNDQVGFSIGTCNYVVRETKTCLAVSAVIDVVCFELRVEDQAAKETFNASLNEMIADVGGLWIEMMNPQVALFSVDSSCLVYADK